MKEAIPYEELVKRANLSQLAIDTANRMRVTCADVTLNFAETDSCDGTVEEREARAALIVHWSRHFGALMDAARAAREQVEAHTEGTGDLSFEQSAWSPLWTQLNSAIVNCENVCGSRKEAQPCE